MKKSLFILCIILITSINDIWAQAPYTPPDKDNEPVSNAMVFIKNMGQVIDNTNAVRNDIKYYMNSSTPSVYCMNDRVSLTWLELDPSINRDSIPMDSILGDSANHYRLDMQFLEEGSPLTIAPTSGEQVSQYYNFYMNYLSGGGLTNVPAHNRIVYENVWTDIDVHLTTNLIAPKMYFVIHPNADPNDISLQFTGQDDINIQSNGALSFLLGNQTIHMPELEAYEVDPNTSQITNLNWFPDWENPNSGNLVTVSTGTYNQDNYLVLVSSKKVGALAAAVAPNDLLKWSTYAGTQGKDLYYDLKHDPNNNNELITCGFAGNNFFAGQPGIVNDFLHEKGQDGVISKFRENGELRWVAYYGTAGTYDWVENLAIKSNGDIYFVAHVGDGSGTSNAPMFKLSVNGGSYNVTSRAYLDYNVLGTIRKDGMQLKWATSFDGIINNMAFDNNNILYGVGYTHYNSSAPSFPLTIRIGSNPYYQGTHGGGSWDGIIVRFDNNDNLTWLTYFGGSGNDIINDLTIDAKNQIYFVGKTSSSKTKYTHTGAGLFPIEFLSASTRRINYNGGLSDGFYGKLNSDGELKISNYFGTWGEDDITSVTINNKTDTNKKSYVTFGGSTNGTNIEPYHLCLNYLRYCDFDLGVDANGDSTFDMMAASFEVYLNDDRFDLRFSSYIGGDGDDRLASIEADENNNLAFYGVTNTIYGSNSKPYCLSNLTSPPTCNRLFGNSYVQHDRLLQDQDGYIFLMDSNYLINWATFFGSTRNARLGNITITPTGNLYVAQTESSQNFPIRDPGSPAYISLGQGSGDAFISKFSDIITLNEIVSVSSAESNKEEFTLYPNPSNSNTTLKAKGNIIRYSIYDISGKLIEYRKTNSKEVNIDNSNKSQGIYILQAESEFGSETKKMIVK